MAKAYNFQTLSTETSFHGEMICVNCNKSIDRGDYGCWQNDNGFVTVHRKCSTSQRLDFDKKDQDIMNAIKEEAEKENHYRKIYEDHGYEAALHDAEYCNQNIVNLKRELREAHEHIF